MQIKFIFSILCTMALAEENARSVFGPDHEYMLGLVPSSMLADPVVDNFGLPGMYQDLKIELAGGSFQCFYQRMQKDAKIFVFFEVLKGSDKNINVEVIQPSGVALRSFEWIGEGELDTTASEDGIYTICLDNRLSKFSNKIVTLYLHTFFEEQWDKYNLDLQESMSSVSNYLSFGVIDAHVKRVTNLARTDGKHMIKDWYLISDNNRFVQRASIFLCVLIVVVSFMQAMFVKKLFTVSASKPRV